MKLAVGAVSCHSIKFKETENYRLYGPRRFDTLCKH